MHNTGNPLPSKDILDLYDNSEVVDNFVNSQQDEIPDRFGTKRLTLAGLIKRSMALRNEINDFSGALTFKPEWTDVPMNVSEGVGGEGGALNLQAEALGNRTEINKIISRETLRRTYLEVGLNLVDGSFEQGANITSTTDVVLHEKTGKCYSGPIGGVVSPTNPTDGGFVDRSAEITLRFNTVEEMREFKGFSLGQKVEWLGYYSPNDGGGNKGIVVSGPLVDDGGSVFVTVGGFTIEASHRGGAIRAKTFGIHADFTTDDKQQLSRLWGFAPQGSEIIYPAGYIKVVGGLVHPLKMLTHTGAGVGMSWVPSTSRIEGTAFYFPKIIAGDGTKGGFYMPPGAEGISCRFATFKNLSLFGDGTNDDTGTVTCLQINNLGTHLDNVVIRYGLVGIEVNYSVAANWNKVTAVASKWAVVHRKDPGVDFGSDINSIATVNNYQHISVHTGLANPDAIGWYIDATCSYGNNYHGGSWDCESCGTGMVIEGRVAAKDYSTVKAHGAGAWQGAGNIFDGVWFERNKDRNMKIVFDAGAGEPALIMRGLYQDSLKISSTSDIQAVNLRPNGLLPLVLGTRKDAPQGSLGSWGTPFTVSQYLLHGMAGNFPLTRTIINEKISRKLGNRTSLDEKGGYSWSYASDNVPGIEGALNIANLDFMSNYKTAIVEYKASCLTNTGGAYFVTGKLAVSIINGEISYTVISGTDNCHPTGFKAIEFRALEVSENVFGLFINKNAGITSVLRVTIDLDYTVCASHTGDRRSILTTFEV